MAMDSHTDEHTHTQQGQSEEKGRVMASMRTLYPNTCAGVRAWARHMRNVR